MALEVRLVVWGKVQFGGHQDGWSQWPMEADWQLLGVGRGGGMHQPPRGIGGGLGMKRPPRKLLLARTEVG